MKIGVCRRIALLVGGFAVVAGVAPAVAVAQAVPQADVQSVVDGSNAFATDLYSQLVRENTGNLFYSPYSISSAMGMVYAGAEAGTARQIDRTMHFTLPDAQLHPALGALTDQLNAGGTQGSTVLYKLNVANAIFGQTGFGYRNRFLKILSTDYGAALQQVDFNGGNAQAVAEINNWAAAKTHNRIPQILSSVSPFTRMVLVDAIYFKSSWQSPFVVSSTENEPFNVDAQTAVQVPLMSQESDFKYIENANLQGISLPYQNGALSMVVLLPKEADGLAEIEAKLTPQKLNTWLDHMAVTDVQVYLPKFTFTFNMDLEAELKSLGVVAAFDPNRANFAGVTTSGQLYIDQAVHKAFVAVDESGTEAAAATAIVFRPFDIISLPKPAVFRADHPFLFLIRDNATGTILFIGRVMNPAS